MSTRSVIARPTKAGFKGVYHHWDGYPEGVGQTLFEAYNGFFGRDLDAMLKYLIDDHPAGWSTINGKDLSRAPGFIEFGGAFKGTCECGEPYDAHLCQTSGINGHLALERPYPCNAGAPATYYAEHLGHPFMPDAASIAAQADAASIPECYCHGERSEPGRAVTHRNAAGMGCEWAYVLKQTPDGAQMMVLSSYTDIGSPDGSVSQKMIGFFGMGDKHAEWKPVAVIGLDSARAPDWEKIGESEPLAEVTV